ncbi:glycosyltransferase family 2 protein [Chryseobacterium wanjuense]
MISDLYFQTLKPLYELDFMNAAHWLLPRNTIETVGGFNPFFFHYGEDNEYVNRVHFHKKKVFLAPESKVVHDGKQSLQKVDYTKYEDLRIETNIMNPNLPNAFQLEKKALLQSMFKNFFLLNIKKTKDIFNKYQNISKKSDLLMK